MTRISRKDRKSILHHYNQGNSVKEMLTWARFRFISPADVQAVIDDEYNKPEPPVPTAESKKAELAAELFPNVETWERDGLMDDLINVLRNELT